ncbi:hypothetical protein HPB50_022288 [Hyalomma asiaticum]|uniref:Uncharacterized protein n=1 Tax=Hyalomma asiaticum TaxID=266040 RepID=A0ACB7TK82_HYAAI|nr:hypothetical protein HPB50_022288 [Hyalomma asiaticum]
MPLVPGNGTSQGAAHGCGGLPHDEHAFPRPEPKLGCPEFYVGFFRIIAALSRDSSGGRLWEKSFSSCRDRAHGVYSGLCTAPGPVGPVPGAAAVFCCMIRESQSRGRTAWRLLDFR